MTIKIKTQKGFSFMEIIISVALIVMISTLIFFSFNSLNNRQSFDKQTDFIKSTINKARINALNLKNGQDQVITFSTSSIIYDGNRFDFDNDFILSKYTFPTNTLIFYRLTGLPNATGTLIYNLKEDNKVIASSSIIINNLGIIE